MSRLQDFREDWEMTLLTKLDDWKNCMYLLEKVKNSRGDLQKVHLEQFIEYKERYGEKYKERFNPCKKPQGYDLK